MTDQLKFRATPEEQAVVKRKAQLAGVTVSAFLRSSALTHGVGVLTAEQAAELRTVVRQLQGACINLNQIALAINRRSDKLPNTDTLQEIDGQLEEIHELMATIRRLLTL